VHLGGGGRSSAFSLLSLSLSLNKRTLLLALDGMAGGETGLPVGAPLCVTARMGGARCHGPA